MRPLPLNNTQLLVQLLFFLLEQEVDTSEKLPSSHLMQKSHQFLKAVTMFNNEEKTTFQFLSNCGTYCRSCPNCRSHVPHTDPL